MSERLGTERHNVVFSKALFWAPRQRHAGTKNNAIGHRRIFMLTSGYKGAFWPPLLCRPCMKEAARKKLCLLLAVAPGSSLCDIHNAKATTQATFMCQQEVGRRMYRRAYLSLHMSLRVCRWICFINSGPRNTPPSPIPLNRSLHTPSLPSSTHHTHRQETKQDESHPHQPCEAGREQAGQEAGGEMATLLSASGTYIRRRGSKGGRQ